MERIYIKEKRMRNTLKWYASALKFYRLIISRTAWLRLRSRYLRAVY